MKAVSNAGKLARIYAKRAAGLSHALRTGLRNAAIAVDNKQVSLLSGGDGAGDYPIPVRTGNLMGGHFFAVRSSSLAVVGNTTSYAEAIHEGKGSSKVYGRRAFLDDAVEAVNVTEIVRNVVKRKVLVIR